MAWGGGGGGIEGEWGREGGEVEGPWGEGGGGIEGEWGREGGEVEGRLRRERGEGGDVAVIGGCCTGGRKRRGGEGWSGRHGETEEVGGISREAFFRRQALCLTVVRFRVGIVSICTRHLTAALSAQICVCSSPQWSRCREKIVVGIPGRRCQTLLSYGVLTRPPSSWSEDRHRIVTVLFPE